MADRFVPQFRGINRGASFWSLKALIGDSGLKHACRQEIVIETSICIANGHTFHDIGDLLVAHVMAKVKETGLETLIMTVPKHTELYNRFGYSLDETVDLTPPPHPKDENVVDEVKEIERGKPYKVCFMSKR